MALHKDEAIILLKRNFGESDKIIHLFTLSSGKVAAIAKGAGKSQKRFMNTLEPFNHIMVEYFEKTGKGLVRIENADLVTTNGGIETSLRKASTAGFFTEFIDRLTKERERHPDIFALLCELLNTIKEREFLYSEILHYQLRFLETLGFMPNFHACVYCGKEVSEPEKLRFSRERGGILCPVCSRFLPHRQYPTGIIPRLAAAGATLFGRQDPHFEEYAGDLMEGFVSFHLEIECRSYRILKNALRR